jgi:hypothetical protein
MNSANSFADGLARAGEPSTSSEDCACRCHPDANPRNPPPASTPHGDQRKVPIYTKVVIEDDVVLGLAGEGGAALRGSRGKWKL